MITLEGVVKRFGPMTAVDDLSLTIEAGAFAVLIGPSGCGKSTALRMINALLTPDAGTIAIDGRDVRETPPEHLRRGIGYAIQSVGLFPHWSVADNILALPRLLRWDAGRIKRRLDDIVALVGIDPALLPRRPHELSGGQQQRIGVARALAGDPAIVLMDEPFSALDPVSRANLQGEMVRIHKESGKTIVFVTHDMDEALALATQLFILDRGRLVQGGPPVRLLREPANDFVASFLGGTARHMRLLDRETVATRMRQGIADTADIEAAASLKTALDVMLAIGRNRLGVADATGRPIGTIDIQDIVVAPAND